MEFSIITPCADVCITMKKFMVDFDLASPANKMDMVQVNRLP